MRSLPYLLFLPFGATLTAQTVSFLPPSIAAFPGTSRGATMCATCIAVADFNGDGRPDIAYAATLLTPVAGVVLGNYDGTFQPGATFSSDNSQNGLFAADFTGDGKADVLISGSPTTSLFTGKGDGTFS